MYTLEGVSSVANFITVMKSLNKNDSNCLIYSVFVVSKGYLFDIYYNGKKNLKKKSSSLNP